MSQVDDRIVALEFDNKDFEQGAKQSLQTIEELKKSMKFDDMSKNLANFSKNAAKDLDLTKIGSAVESLKDRFSATGIAGMEVIKRVTNFALDAGKKITSSLAKPFQIMWTGGSDRARNIDNAKFQLEGLGVAWENLYDDIDYAVAGTAYGLDQAAIAASQLTASGVQAGNEMKAALRGISGVAAMTNSTYDEISPIFTTVAGQGKLMTMQLRQLESRGLNAAASLATAFNDISDGKYADEISDNVKSAVKSITNGKKVTETDIRDLVTKGKIHFDEFSAAMDLAFGEHAKEANKTFEGAMGNMQFALKKIGAEFFTPYRQAMIPVFNEVRQMINAIKGNMEGIFPIVKDVMFLLSNVITNKIASITKFLKNDFTGAEHIANGLRNIVQIVIRLTAAVSTAFKEVFGSSKSVGDTVNNLAEGFDNLTKRLIPSNEALTVLKNVIVAVLTVVKNLWINIKPVLSFAGKIASVLLKVVGTVVTLIVKLLALGTTLVTNTRWFKAIENSGGLLMFAFQKIVDVVTKVKNLFSDSTTIFGKFANSVKSVISTIAGVAGGLLFTAIGKIIDTIAYVKNNFPAVLESIKTRISDFINTIKQIPIVSTAFENIKFIFEKIKTIVVGVTAAIKTLFSSFRGETTRSAGDIQPLNSGMETFYNVAEKIVKVLRILGGLAGGSLLTILSVFNTLVSVIKSINLDSVISKFKELVARIRDLDLVRTAVDTFRNSGGNLVETLKAVVDKIREFFTSLRESGVSVLDFFVDKIKAVIGVIKDFFSSFAKDDVSDGLTRSIESKSSLFDTLKDKFVKAKDVIVKGLTKIRDEGLLTKVLMVAYVMAILKALIQIPSSINRVSKSLTGEGGIFTNLKGFTENLTNFVTDLRGGVKEGTSLFGSLKEAVTQWGKAQRKSKIELLGGLLKDIAIAVGILAASLAVLTLVDTDKLKEVAIVLGIFSAVLITIAGAITYASNTNLIKSTWFSSFAANMLAMTASIGILGGLLLAFSKVEITDVKSAVGILVATMALMVVFGLVIKKMAGLDFSGATLRSSIFMLAFALSLKSLVKALKDLSTIKITDQDSFIIALIGVVGTMAVLVGAASAINPASALAVVAIVFAIGKIFKAIKEVFSGIKFSELSKLIVECKTQLAVVLVAISAAVTAITITALVLSAKIAVAGAAIGKGLLQVGAAFLLFGAGLLMIESAIKKISKLELDQTALDNIGQILVGILGAFAIILLLNKVLGGVDTALLKIGASIALLSIAMFNVSIVAHIVKNLEPGPIIKALSILMTIMASMALMVLAVKSGNGTLAFKTVLATVIGFTVLIGALLVLGVMCGNEKVFKDLAKALALIVVIMMSMALVLNQVSKIRTGKSWAPILSMVLMLGAVIGALYLLSQNIHSMEELVALAGIAAIILVTIGVLIHLTKSLTKFAKENNLGKSKAVLKALEAMGVMLLGFVGVAAVLGVFAVATKDIGTLEIMGKSLAIIATLGVLVLAAEKMSTMTKKIKKGDFAKFAAIMGTMLLAFAAVAAVLWIVGKLDFGNGLLGKVVAIGLVLAELVGLSLLMGKFGTASADTFKAIGALALMTIIFGILGVVCGIISTFPGEGMLAKTQIVALVLAELVAINAILGKLGAKNNALGALGSVLLLPLIAVFGLLAIVCSIINSLNLDGFLAKSQIVILVLTELVAINALLGVLVEASGVGAVGAVGAILLIPLIAVFGLLALVCAAINMIPVQEGFLAKTQIIILVLTELVAINALLGVLVLAAGVGALGAVGAICLIPLIAIFGLLALVCAAINLLPLDGVADKIRVVMNTLWEMVGMLAVLGLLGPLAALSLIAMPALLSVCVALLAITAAIKLLEGSDISGMQQTVDLLTTTLLTLVGIGMLATAASVGLVALGTAILTMGLACLAAGAGVLLFAQGIASLASTTPQQLQNLQMTILTFCNTISVGIVTIITSTGQAIIATVTNIINGVVAAIAGGVAGIIQAAQMLGTGLVDSFKTSAMEIAKVPGDIIQALVMGIAGSIGALFSAGMEMGSKLVEGFRQATGWHSPPEFLVKFFADAGVAVNQNAQGVTDLFDGTGKTWGDAIKIAFDSKVKGWDFSNLYQKGAGAVQNIIGGLKSQEGGLLSEVNFLNNIMGQLANAANLSTKGFQTTLSDFEYQLKGERQKLINQRNEVDYVNGTKAQKEKYKALNNAIGEYDDKLKKNSELMGKAAEASAKLDENLNKNASSFGKAGGAAGGASKEMKSFADDLTGVLEGQMDIFKKFEKKEAMSKTELLENMRSQIKGMTEWAADMQMLAAKGIDEGLYEKLAMMGPQGAEYVGAFKEMTAEELAEANQLWAQSLVLPKTVAGQVAGAFNGIGKGIMEGASSGVLEGTQQYVDQVNQSISQGPEEANKVLEINSPSHVFQRIGEGIDEGLALGIRQNARDPINEIVSICKSIYDDAKGNLSPSLFYGIGVNLINGLTAGLKDKEALKKLAEQLKKLAALIEGEEQKENEIESPSKRWRDNIGKFLVLGLAEGIKMYSGEAVKAVDYLSDKTIDAMKETIELVGEQIQSMDDDLTITPVLDLTNVQSGMKTLSNMFSADQALSASASLNGDLQNGQLNGSKLGTTFIQNNYSPKALSRVEIYRQTKNQFAQYREAFS